MQRFHDQRRASRQRRAHLLLRVDQPHLARKQCTDARAHARAIAREIGLVVREEIGKGGDALRRCIRIEHDADDAQEAVVLDHQDVRSAAKQAPGIAPG